MNQEPRYRKAIRPTVKVFTMEVNSVTRSPNWRPTGADLYSTGASRPAPERVHVVAISAGTGGAVAPALASGVMSSIEAARKAELDAPVHVTDSSNVDWTIKKTEAEKTEQPPPKPLYLKLIEQLQAMWRASGNAVEVVDELNKTVNPAKLAQGPLVYPDPKLKKVSNS